MRLFALIFVLSGAISASAQLQQIKPGRPIVCYAETVDHNTVIPPPAEYNFLKNNPSARVQTAVFNVTYVGFTAEAKAAFQKAVDIWSTLITTSQPITIHAQWTALSSGVLGSAIWGGAYANFPGAPQVDTYYPVALAEKLANRPLNGIDSADIVANFSNAINWSYDINGTPVSGKYDLVSVVLHEIGHGLGFVDSYGVSGTDGFYGVSNNMPIIYDLFLENGSTKNLFVNYASPSNALFKQLTSAAVYFNSPQAVTANGGSHARIYAPSTFSSGSSISHLDENSFPSGNANSLMTPAIGMQEVMHDPGPIVKGAFSDMGWVSTRIDHTPLTNTENVNGPFTITAVITSDIGSIANINLHFNTGGSDNTVSMLPTGNANEYAASIPSTGVPTTYNYYISVDDAIRSNTNPGKRTAYQTGVTQTYFQFTAAPDIIPPVITHTPTKVILNTLDTLVITATVTDNLGVDSVGISYSINNGTFTNAGLIVSADSDFTYKLPLSDLQIGDSIRYNLFARDKAVIGNASGNTTTSPAAGYYHVGVTGLQDPVGSYANNFDAPSTDFFGDFDINQAAGFSNPAINSPHPYAEGYQFPGSAKNYTYELLYPIIVQSQDATIKFDEVVLVEPGADGAVFGTADFFDYVAVEGSTDNGKTWTPVADGWDSNANTDWLSRFNSGFSGNNSTGVGEAALYKPRTLNLLNKFTAGQTVVLRFRLYSDPYAAGWGWAIDNLRVQVDETPPTVLHNHVDFIKPDSPSLPLEASVSDFSGVADLAVEYTVNNGEVNTFSFDLGQNTPTHSVNLDVGSIAAGDTIHYRLVATDNVSNVGYLPTNGTFDAIVFQPTDTLTTYENDFNTASADFIGNFYARQTPSGFSNGLISLTHPYALGFGLNSESNFSYMLTHPITIQSENAYMRFDEIAIVETHAPIVHFGDANFNDYVIVEGSDDGGTTWTRFLDGYDANEQSVWTTAFNNKANGSKSMFVSRTIDLTKHTGFQAGDVILIRFRLYSNATLNGWGWAIDNLAIQSAVTGTEGEVSLAMDLYPNPAVDSFTVDFRNATSGAVSIQVYNVQGQRVINQTHDLRSGHVAVSTADQLEGLYLVKIQQGSRSVTRKLAIKH